MPQSKDLANALRFLSIDAVQKANSGHPGMPMGMADIAEVLWRDFLKHNPNDPKWLNRDRFVLSNGHGSMLLYSLLHLTGYKLSLEDLKNFRQLNSKTPGHPEHDLEFGVETTTGPLGQGLANAVGMALAEKVLAQQFNRPKYTVIDHYTYVFLGDGCLMEGISHEACSLAGTHQLSKLIGFWDNNGISIDGEVKDWFTDNTPERFEGYGWHVVRDVDGHDPESIKKAIQEARFVTDKPSLICCKTIIGYGSPNLHGTSKTHGAPLGEDEIAATRKNLGWAYKPFEIPEDIYSSWNAKPRGQMLQKYWNQMFTAYKGEYPELSQELLRRIAGTLPDNFTDDAEKFIKDLNKQQIDVATRKASQLSLEQFGPLLPEFLGGSADLTGSNLTNWAGSKSITAQSYDGNYMHYGVREFATFALMNGIALHGGFIPYSGTFLIFSDYGRNAMRLAALMGIRVIYVLTHDSIGLGEDGPTHQAVEQVSGLRLIPNMTVWRPCDVVETAVAWQYAIEHQNGPTSLILTRQKVTQQPRDAKTLANINRGGYILFEPKGKPEGIIIATGSEVELAIEAAKEMQQQGNNIRVVSMPATEIFDQQDQAYKNEVLPLEITARVAIEAAKSDFWYKYVGLNGKVIGIDTFGKSAPAKELFADFGFTAHNIVLSLQQLLQK